MKRRRYTIGAYGPLTVEQARRKALELLAQIANGSDPSEAAAEERRSLKEDTVEALFAQYLEDGVGRRKESTREFYESLGRLYVLPALGELPIAKVSARDVAELHLGLREKPTTANRVARLVRSFFYWLERRELFKGDNPAARTDWYPEAARERFLTVEEMSKLGQALHIAETEGLEPAPQHRKALGTKRRRNTGMFTAEHQPANPFAVAALRFLMLTGWPESEALTLRWDAADFDNGRVTLQDTKSGRSVRPLPAPALELIASLPRELGSPYVFPGRVPGQPLRELQRLWYAVRHSAGLEGVRLHDLRHSVASIAGAQGYSLLLIGKLLGHKDQRSTARYAHLSDDARKTMADSVGNEIQRAIGGAASPKVIAPGGTSRRT